MKALVSVKIALLPFAVFWLGSGLHYPFAGAVIGALLAAAALVYRVRSGGPLLLEGVALAGLAMLALATQLAFASVAAQGAAWSFIMLGGACAASVLAGRPWTGAYAAPAWQGVAQTPLFHQINRFLSSLWAALFGYLGVAKLFGFAPAVAWVPAGAGIAASILLPRWMVRRHLQQRIAARTPYPWPAPDFGAMPASDADVVVVGAGIGGLTAAALLAQSGLRVVVAEQHGVPGGFAHTWLRKGKDGDARPVFRFDSGVHDISGWWDGAPVHGIFQRLGVERHIDWRRLDHRFVTEQHAFDVPRRWDDYVAQLATTFPSAAPGIRAALADIRDIHAAMYSGAAAQSGIPGAPQTVDGLLAFARRYPLAVRWLDKPFAELLENHIADPAARQAIMALAGYVTDDAASATVYQMVPLFGYYLHGGFYPVGGSGMIAEALVDAIESHGGAVRLKTPVAQVLVENGVARGVTLRTGETIRAAAVVMNADLMEATRTLVAPDAWPADFRQSIAAAAPSCSAFAVHLGVRGDFAGMKPIIHVTAPSAHVGIVIPSVVDPTAAPPGYSCVELLRLVSHADAATWFADAQRADDAPLRHSRAYLARKARLGDEMIAAAEQVLPGLSERIVLRCDASPVTFRRYAWSTAGAIYGIRPAAEAIGTKSPLPGLVFAGAMTHGPGIEAVVISGARAAEALVPGLLASPAAQRDTRNSPSRKVA